MSSASKITDKGLFSTFLAIHHISSEDEDTTKPAEQPVEKPAEGGKSMWRPGGYQPSRASWHTTLGKAKSYLA
jgi:hypothetical protein